MRMTILAATAACLMLALPLHAQEAPASARGILNADAVLVTGDQPGPEMWLVRSPDGLRDMYVMAVLSPLPAGMTLQSKRIDAVVANAQEVIRQPYASFTVDTGWVRGLMLLPKVLGARKNPDGKQLEDLVSPASYARWSWSLTPSGVPGTPSFRCMSATSRSRSGYLLSNAGSRWSRS